MTDQIFHTDDSSAMLDLTPARWAAAKSVLLGDHGDRISYGAAAKAADVSLRTLRAWIRRSREENVFDEPWVREIADVCDDLDEIQGGILEDVLWDHAVNGTEKPLMYRGCVVETVREYDHPMTMRLLEVRDKRYRPAPQTQINNLTVDIGELYRRFTATMKLAAAKGLTQGE